MTIEEAVAAKLKLENDIASLIFKFNSDTGLVVTNITITAVNEKLHKQSSFIKIEANIFL